MLHKAMPAPVSSSPVTSAGPASTRKLTAESARLVAWLTSPWAFRIAIGWYAVVLGLGLKRFLVWDQITTLEGAGAWSMLASGHPHTVRWLVMQPAMAWGQWDPHQAFTVLCFAYIVSTAVLLARAGARCAGQGESAALRVWIFIPLALLSLTMNGRLVPAFFGVALLLVLHVERAAGVPRHWAWLLAGQGVGLVCCAVSSGSFVVGALAVVWSWCTALAAVRHNPQTRRRLVIGVTVAVAGLGGASVMLFNKALRFFNHAPLAVLDHGLGGYLLPYGSAITAAGVGLWIALSTLWWWRWPTPRAYGSQVRVVIWASLVFGLLGYATLVTAVPAVILLLALALASPTEIPRAPAELAQ